VNLTVAVDPDPINCRVMKLDELLEGLTKVHQENEQSSSSTSGKLKN